MAIGRLACAVLMKPLGSNLFCNKLLPDNETLCPRSTGSGGHQYDRSLKKAQFKCKPIKQLMDIHGL